MINLPIAKNALQWGRFFHSGIDRKTGRTFYELELEKASKALANTTPEKASNWLKKHGGNIKEVADRVEFRVNADVLAHLFALSFFQNQPLDDDQWPVLTSRFRDSNMLNALTIGEMNGAPKHQYVPNGIHSTHLLEQFSSPIVEYQRRNLQTGDVSEVERVSNEMSYEFNLGLDSLAITLLDAGVLASGLRDTLRLHPSIVAGTIPDKNFMDLTGTDTGKITVSKFRDILEYFVRWQDTEPDSTPLQINTIYMSVLQLKNIWEFVDLVAGFDSSGALIEDPTKTVPGATREQIFNTGIFRTAYGQEFLIVLRNTIASDIMYISSNKPAGYYFNKPGMAEMFTDDSMEARQKNKGRMSRSVVHQFVMPDEWKYRYLKVQV